MNSESVVQYRDGQLYMESISLDSIAEQVETPFYCYSAAAIKARIGDCKSAFENIGATIHYAVKANSNLAVLRLMAEAGLGADIVSEGELARALKAGIQPQDIIFSGVGKRASELLAALDAGIFQFNLESIPELERLADLCKSRRRTANVSIRINPEVDAATHRHITTAVKESKFGIPFSQLDLALKRIARSDSLRLHGLAVHLGSQIVTLEPYEKACRRLREWVIGLRDKGHAITHLDLGGGFGIDYGDGRCLEYGAVATVIDRELRDLGVAIAVEPGRSLVATAGVLVSEVVYRKEVEPVPFLILDAGMNDLLRPALYQASHQLLTLKQSDEAREICNVVGPICESSDSFLQQASLPRVNSGERVALLQAGAYGAVMASGYNSRDVIPEVMITGDQYGLIRRRISHRELMEYEIFA
ncbi:diaminopimelate decarboxylase [Sedimenticola sp.]|uniref:diaminopimelate decarboxylase n=1 Tax=Sedimenticola sp. TaxID=1940285 RepID=UPI00258CC734|nr:diaminopimelate decarboxylase [Sedimenticola sp.]MCW8904852.1 diaminopimelate decarboxylase [Sedimenticola sp.]